MKNYFAISLLITVIVLSGCVSRTTNSNPGEIDLEDAVSIWNSQGITSYQIDIEQECFCGGPFIYRMTVENGQVTAVINLENDDKVSILDSFFTIDDWFNWLQKVNKNDPRKFDLQFNSQYGYPTFIDYDQSFNIDDEELVARFSNFREL